MRISCAFTSLVHHSSIQGRRQATKSLVLPSAGQLLFSTYCVAALSASRVRSLPGTFGSDVLYTVQAFIPNSLPSFPHRYSQNAVSNIRDLKMSSTSANNDSPPVVKRVLVPIADGSEEIETACITDTLTRFGAKVTVASVKKPTDLVCTMSRGLKIVADCSLDDAVAQQDPWDLIVLPGGMPGAEHLRDCTTLQTLLQDHVGVHQRPCGAICAAPAVVLASVSSSSSSSSLLLGSTTTTATCYPAPAFRTQLSDAGMVVSEEDVVVSGSIITSQGPATALAFSLQLGEILYGVEKRKEIAKAMLTV